MGTTRTLSATIHFATDRQTETDRRQYHANILSYCVQQYSRLKTDCKWRHQSDSVTLRTGTF